MKTIQILGTGCTKCKNLAEIADRAARELGQPYHLVKITEIREIMAFGVLSTPALAVDGVVKSAGKVPTLAEVKALLS